MDHQTSNIPSQKVFSYWISFPENDKHPADVGNRLPGSLCQTPVSACCLWLVSPPTSLQPSAPPFTCPCVCFLIKCTKGNGIQTHFTQQRQSFLSLRYLGKGHRRQTRCKKKQKKKSLRYLGKINQDSFEGERHL